MIYGTKTIGNNTKIYLTKVMDDNLISMVFKDYISGGKISGNYFEFGKNLLEFQLLLVERIKVLMMYLIILKNIIIIYL